jgi:hypothetical protein
MVTQSFQRTLHVALHKPGVIDSVGGRMVFSSESEVLNYIKEKSNFLKSNVI